MLDELNALLEKLPFEPFRIVLLNGRQYDVSNPDALVQMDERAFLAERAGDWVVFRLAYICSFESLVDE